MKDYRYIPDTATLHLDAEKCIGCGLCQTVCPHRIFTVIDNKASVLDRDACMECGACTRNCPGEAITVSPGVGCAVEIIARWINGMTGRNVIKGCC